MFDNRVSAHIPNNLPSFVREDYTNFVEFIQNCYSADERRGSSLDILRNILSYKNFNAFDSIQSRTTTLQVSIDDNDTQIELADASGFPTNNGVIRIEDEVILYKTRNGDVLEDCLRGSSYTTELNDIFDTQTYTDSQSSSHDSGVEVEDLTSLVLIETLNQTYSTFLSTLNDEVIDESIRRSIILSRISSFYRSRGAEDGIRVLFKLLYGNIDIDVRYPGEQVLRASDSTWTRRDIIKCELISGDISIVNDNTLYQLTDEYDPNITPANVIVENVKKVSVEGQYIYEISVNTNSRIGTIRPTPRTVLVRSVDVSDTVITVESTYGFSQRNGRFYIGSELIGYAYRTSNQFHECARLTPVSHTSGENVYGVGFIYAYSGDDTTVLRVLGVVNHIDIKDGGLFNVPSDVTFDGTGRTAPGQPILEEWIENTNYELASVYDSSIYDVSTFTHGVNSIHFDENNVFIQSSSLPPSQIGPLGNDGALELRPLSSYCVFPRERKVTPSKISTGNESIGMFVDGVLAQSCRVNEQIISGQITTIDVVSSGAGYNTPPTVIVTGGGGTGVVASSNLNNGRVTSVTLTDGGSGFTSIPSIRFSSGEGASISPVVDSYGRLVSVSVLSGGNYYTDVPEIILVDPTGRGRGSLLSIDPTLIVGGVIQSNAVRIVNRGIDYSSSSYIVVKPTGSGATATATVYTYDKDSYVYVTSNSDYQFDSSSGFVYPRLVGPSKVRNTYCYGNNPSTLRTTLNDDGLNHSPILGYAFDGCPIYGPYGYTDPADSNSPVIRMVSSYQIGSRTGVTPPSVVDYPLGTFIQDYVYTEGLGTLDQYNGRFCVTPDYPDGIYAYFITVDGSNVPQFPYIVGPEFYALPLSQDVKFLNQEQFSDTSKLNVISQNFYGEITLPEYDYSKVVRYRNANLDVLNESVTASITSTTVGSISEVYVDYSDDNYAVGDFCRFDYTDNQGGGCEARVSWVVGEDISTLSMAVPSVQVFLHDQEIDISTPGAVTFAYDDISTIENAIYFDADHDLIDGMRVLFENTSGDIPNGLLDGKTYFVKVVDSTTIRLATSLRDLQNDQMVTISSQGTGNKSLTPIYSIARNRVFTTEGGSEFIVTGWNPSTNVLSVRILNQIRIAVGDTFRDMIGASVYVSTGSVTNQVIDEDQVEIPVNNSAGFSGGDVIQVGVELMYVVEVLENDVLLVKRTDGTHPDINDGTYVVNLSRLAIILNTTGSHDLSLGDVIEIIGASPAFFNGTVVVDDIINSQTVVCLKRLSELDSDYVFDEASTPEGLAFTTTTQPYFVTNLQSGTLWWSSLTGTLHIYYQDTDNGQWVSAIPTGVMPNQMGELTTPVSISGEPSSSGNTITGGVIQICEVAPSTRIDSSELKEGDFWWSSLTGYLYIFYDGLWVPATPTGVAPLESEGAVVPSIGYSAGSSIQRDAVVTVSDNPPTDGDDPVQDGDLWWSSLSGFLYIRYNDQWVIATPIGVWSDEGVSTVSVSTAVGLDIDYLIVLVATGDYFFITSSLSVVGPIYRVDVTVNGSGLNILPDIVGVYPRILDRSQLSVVVNNDGTIDSVSVISGGNRYKNPSVLFISETGSGATATVTLSGGSISSIDIVTAGSGYTEGEVTALVVETGNILIPITDNIGTIDNITVSSVGYYQNFDPTLVPSVDVNVVCTLIDVTGTFVVGGSVTTSSGLFTGIISQWDTNKRMMTITQVDGVLTDGDQLLSNSASGFVLQSGQSDIYARIGAVGELGGNFLTSKSILSSSYQKLLDSYYYQDFSYVISSNRQTSDYRQFVVNNIHPAGYALFGQLSLIDELTTVQSAVVGSILQEPKPHIIIDTPTGDRLIGDDIESLFVFIE